MKPIFEKQDVKIYVDEDPESPRDWDNLGTIVAFHKKYSLSDKPCEYKFEDYSRWDELKQAIIDDHGPCVILPLYLMDHSGLSVSTKPFGCPWDSGKLGYIYCSEARALDEGIDLDKLPEYLEGEIATYDQYLRGEVYGYVRTIPKYTFDQHLTILRDGVPWFRMVDVDHTRDAEELVDMLNAQDSTEESCWGFMGYSPEELADAVLRGEV